MKLTDKQKQVIMLIRKNTLKYNPSTGKYYYLVPTTVRRSGNMTVSQRELKRLVDVGIINTSANLTELGKTIEL